MSIPWTDVATLVTAVASAAAAAGSWKAAHRSASTADRVARIERERWHAELTPQVELDFVETGFGQAIVTVHLAGPDALGHLDEVVISVGNDDMEHQLLHEGNGVTQADVDAHVWGPFRFSPGANRTDDHGRGPEPFELRVGTGRPLAMQRTRPGQWMEGKTQAMWQGEYAGQPIRLVLTCRRGEETWVLARRLENPAFVQPE
ncbi:hypothetical protein [Streptomyces zhihengii]|uniref:Uncharacterized protein n=1 Tax=Streptomyces zhihengii TaxID=1818004 RepID=A0ABS2V4T1_9ACTN|nr:hypothetical protein [Streptomyces zhihengii]MBM9624830.1 hypothetical protein [Streptomyces zhihengii]